MCGANRGERWRGVGLHPKRSAAGLKSRPYGMSCNSLRDSSSAPVGEGVWK